MGMFKRDLEHKRTELLRSTGQRDDIAVERIADEVDACRQASEREIAVRNLDRQVLLLRNVEAALHRIETGEYGICVHCEEEINPKRLQAVPWAPLCLTCQEAADRNEAGVLGSLRAMMDAA